MKDRALFLDRDGTLVHARHYPSRPDQLMIYDGIGEGLRALQAAGFRLVVVTNQAGIARGYFTEEDLDAMHQHLRGEMARMGVWLDAIYYCPHHIDGAIPALAVHCECRKPRPGMLRRAATDLRLDLERSWLVGDILDDIEAGRRAGCRTVLVDLGTERPPAVPLRLPHYVARNTRHALDIIQSREGLLSGVECTYLPASWHNSVPTWTGHMDAMPLTGTLEGGSHALSR